MAIGLGVLLPGVAENPTFPILRALAYTTGLGDRPTCDRAMVVAPNRGFLRSSNLPVSLKFTSDRPQTAPVAMVTKIWEF